MNTKPETEQQPIFEPPPVESPHLLAECLLAISGLLLTVFSTFIQAFFTNPPWEWLQGGVYPQPLGTTYQVGAVLLTACVGGPNAGAMAQIGYVLLGLGWLPVFAHGGGWDYWQEPTFGYILGFIPGAWVCGRLAYRERAKIEALAVSALTGLGIIHGVGLFYLTAITALRLSQNFPLSWKELPQAYLSFSLFPLPGQMIVVCLGVVLAFFLRKILFF